jgi:hypothetical protein
VNIVQIFFGKMQQYMVVNYSFGRPDFDQDFGLTLGEPAPTNAAWQNQLVHLEAHTDDNYLQSNIFNISKCWNCDNYPQSNIFNISKC